MAQNNKDAAIKSYNNAWELLRSRQETRAVLALKMESLGIVPEPIAPQAGLIQEPAMPAQPDVAEGENSVNISE